MKKNLPTILLGAVLSIAVSTFGANVFAQGAGGGGAAGAGAGASGGSGGSMGSGSSGPVAGSVPGPAGSDVPSNPGVSAMNSGGGANNSEAGSSTSGEGSINPSTSPAGVDAGAPDATGNSTNQAPAGVPSLSPAPNTR